MNTHENRLKDFIYFLSISHSSILNISSHLIISYMTLIILTLKSTLPGTSFRIFLNQAKGQQVQFGSVDITQYFHLFPKAKHSRGEVILTNGKIFCNINFRSFSSLLFNLQLLSYTPCVYLCVQKKKKKKNKQPGLLTLLSHLTLGNISLFCI